MPILCTVCETEQNADQFTRSGLQKDGTKGRCKSCRRVENAAQMRKRAANFVPPVRTGALIHCRHCKTDQPDHNFAIKVSSKTGFETKCKTCVSRREKAKRRVDPEFLPQLATKARIWRKENPQTYLLRVCKSRAKKKGLPFSITEHDIPIPTHCPILGTKLEFSFNGVSPNSPSIDKFIPERGYVPGNVSVISHRANWLKNSASIEEVQMVLDWMIEQHRKVAA